MSMTANQRIFSASVEILIQNQLPTYKGSPFANAVTVPINMPFTLDASSSYDTTTQPSTTNNYSPCGMTCTILPLPVLGYSACNEILIQPNASNPCKFSINQNVLSTLYQTNTSVNVTIQAGQTIFTTLLLPSPTRIQASINLISPGIPPFVGLDNPISVQAVATSSNASITINPSFSWSINCTLQTTCPELSSITSTRINQAYLSILPQSLNGGAEYTLTVTVTDLNKQSSPATASFTFFVTAPPQPIINQGLYICPNPATALDVDDPIKFGAGEWTGSDLYYQYGYVNIPNANILTVPSTAIRYVFTTPLTNAITAVVPFLAAGEYTVFAMVTAGVDYNAPSSTILALSYPYVVSAPAGSGTPIQQIQNIINSLPPNPSLPVIVGVANPLLDQLNALAPTSSALLDLQNARNTLVSAVLAAAANAAGNSTIDATSYGLVLSTLQVSTQAPIQVNNNLASQIIGFLSSYANLTTTVSAANDYVASVSGIVLSKSVNPPAISANFTPFQGGNATANYLTEQDSATLRNGLRAALSSLLSNTICDAAPIVITSAAVSAQISLTSSPGGINLGFNGGSIVTPSGFSLQPSAGACTGYHFLQHSLNPYSWQENTNYSIPGAVLSIEFYESGASLPLAVSDLPLGQQLTISLPFPQGGADSTNVSCTFWDTAILDWNTFGCEKSSQTTSTLLVCNCNHTTEFTLGTLIVQVNVIDVNNVNLHSEGLIVAWCTIAGIVFLYIVVGVYAIIMDARFFASAHVPDQAETTEFVKKHFQLYNTKIPARVLHTMHLDTWKEAYGTEWWPEGTRLGLGMRLLMYSRYAILYNHSYVSIFFPPIHMGTRFARLTCTIGSILVTLAISAVFYQSDAIYSQFSTVIVLKIAVGFIVSAITYFPFAIIQFLFRHIRRPGLINSQRDHSLLELKATNLSKASTARNPLYDENDDVPSAPKLRIDSVAIRDLISFNNFYDFLLPFWVEYLLYLVCFLLGIGGIIVTGFYGASFDTETTIGWIESFFISIAVNIVILQTLQSVLGAVLTVVFGAFSAIAGGVALVVTTATLQNS